MTSMPTGAPYVPADAIRGASLFDRSGHKLGTIKEIYLSPDTGQIGYVLGSTGGFLGVNAKYHPLPWRLLTLSQGPAGYVTAFDKHDLDEAPAYDQEQLDSPQYAWNEHVDAYFNQRSLPA